MDKEQLTLSDFKKWSSTALKTFNNYTIIMTNNRNRTKYHYECGVFVSVAYFLVNSTGCSGKFHVVFKHFQSLENLLLNILKGNCISIALQAFRKAQCKQPRLVKS